MPAPEPVKANARNPFAMHLQSPPEPIQNSITPRVADAKKHPNNGRYSDTNFESGLGKDVAKRTSGNEIL